MKNNIFGKKLKELRIEKGLSQQKLDGTKENRKVK